MIVICALGSRVRKVRAAVTPATSLPTITNRAGLNFTVVILPQLVSRMYPAQNHC